MNDELAKIAIQFLDRVATTGHKERHAMDVVCNALAEFLEKKEEEPTANPCPVKGELVD